MHRNLVARPSPEHGRATTLVHAQKSGCTGLPEHGHATTLVHAQKPGCTALHRARSCNHSVPCTEIRLHGPPLSMVMQPLWYMHRNLVARPTGHGRTTTLVHAQNLVAR